MTKDEMLTMITLLERLGDLRQLWVEDEANDPIHQMSLYLIKRHLTGQITTPTSLARSSKLPHATATRRVSRMKALGLLDYRTRTDTGRSYSVHPSPKLIAKVTSYLVSIQAAISTSQTGLRQAVASVAQENRINPPSIAREKLGFHGGLDILVLNDPAYAIGKPLNRELNYLMGGRVRFHEASIDTLRGKIVENSRKEQSLYDVIAVDLPTIAEFASSGLLLPLEDIAAQSQLNSVDFVSAAWEGTIVGTIQYAIPILINPQLLFYREDILAKMSMSPPSNTNELLDIAQRFHRPHEGRYGVSWTGARGGPVGQAFIQFLADFGQPVIQLERSVGSFKAPSPGRQKLQPTIETERGFATAQFMLQLLDVSVPDVLDLSWEDQISWLREGAVVLAYEWANRATQLTGFQNAGQVGFLPHPTGEPNANGAAPGPVAPIGGFAFAIPSNLPPQKVQTAWNAIEWMSSPQILKLQAQYAGCVTPRRSVAADPDVRQFSPMIAAVDHMDKQGQISLWPRPPVAQYTQIVGIIGEEIHDMLCGRQSIEAALRQAQARADTI